MFLPKIEMSQNNESEVKYATVIDRYVVKGYATPARQWVKGLYWYVLHSLLVNLKT